MTLRVTNTLSGERETFEPDGDEVLLYLCGLTTSDPAHLGHARTWVHTDVMHRWLEHLGYDVQHVENFTDVNEKIVARVGADGESEFDVGRHYISEFLRDMRSLNLKRATVYPKVTEHIDDIISMIETLIDKGYAYESNGSVYFDVAEFDEYGKLSNQQLEEMESQADPDERAEKKRAADFALWKSGDVDTATVKENRRDDAAPVTDACETAMTWDSPWGEGRPGWHIECSVMSTKHLDTTFDIHVAGEDLVFPHNENEIAQAEAAHGEQFARYWLHVGLLETEGEKMSSSLQNYFTVENAIEEFGPNSIRTFLLSTTYSEKQTYSEATLNECFERWDRLDRSYRRAVEAADSPEAATTVTDGELRDAVETCETTFTEAMNDDFNTRRAISALDSLAGVINSHIDTSEEYDYQGLRRSIELFEMLGGDVLGLSLGSEPESDIEIAEDLIELILEIREAEREAGNYTRADELRDELEELGISVQDTDTGPVYEIEQ